MPTSAPTGTPPPLTAPVPAAFRHVLGHVPTSVCVVTATTDAGPVGVTVGSFTSVSLEPPLVAFWAGTASASAEAIAGAGRFGVNVLAEDQQEVCAAFARRTPDRFATGDWAYPPDGPPRLGGAAAWLTCDVEGSVPAGDHVMVIGRVLDLAAADGPRRPLLFHRGRLVRLDRAHAVHAPTHSFGWWDR
ncbi:flavin reductase family protein [Streptomyces sp. SID7909]|uniref:flavin reductase n=1 Tax=Streptomyces sp. SID7909 TaxID=2706092 RepID=UPI0013BBFAE9|nr:flavin reductase family protein [Streptomyces sp. SID7909]